MNITKKLITVNHGGPRDMPVDMIVVHATEGDRGSVISWFNDPAANVSAHYMVQKDGVIVQFVEEANVAWHAGRVDAPTAPLVLARPGVNPNRYSIGIEHENSGHEALTPEQRASSVALIADISTRHPVSLDTKHVVGHHTVYSRKACPGSIDVPDLIRRAVPVPMPVPVPVPVPARPPMPVLVWSDYFGDWLVVLKVVSDGEWYFTPFKTVALGSQPTRGQTPLSRMPR